MVDSTSSIVTRTDVKTVAERYRTMPGLGMYDTRIDFKKNYGAEIAEISTVAAKM